MDTHRFFVENVRFHLNQSDTLVFVGWFFDGTTENHALSVCFDREELPFSLQVNKGAQVRQKYRGSGYEIREEVLGIVTLPDGWRDGGRLTIASVRHGKEREDYSVSVKKLKSLQEEINYCIENCHRDEGSITVSGWCMGGGEIKLSLLDDKKQPMRVKIEHAYRKDLLGVYPEADEEARPGFLIEAGDVPSSLHTIYLEMRGATRVSTVKLKKWEHESFFWRFAQRAGQRR